jgi:hypothetical protein
MLMTYASHVSALQHHFERVLEWSMICDCRTLTQFPQALIRAGSQFEIDEVDSSPLSN